jgi:elongation factor P
LAPPESPALLPLRLERRSQYVILSCNQYVILSGAKNPALRLRTTQVVVVVPKVAEENRSRLPDYSSAACSFSCVDLNVQATIVYNIFIEINEKGLPVSISTADFKNGKAILLDGKPNIIIEFQHVKPGKGGAFVRTKVRDIRTGRVNDLTFRSGEKFDEIRMEQKEMQFLYADGDEFNFMDTESYEQIALTTNVVGDAAKWLKENDVASLQYAGEELIGVEPPMFVELEVTETEPGFKGDTVQGGTKPATLQTGAVVQVPMFINNGDVLKIDTRDARYITRV